MIAAPRTALRTVTTGQRADAQAPTAVYVRVPSHIPLLTPLLTNGYRVAGLSVAIIVPAAFWIATVYTLAAWAGFSLTGSVLIPLAVAIILFLGAVCGPIMLRAED